MKIFRFINSTFVCAVAFISASTLWAQTRPLVIEGATLIDGTGRAAVTDSVVVIQDGRFQIVGKRGEVSMPQGAEVFFPD